MRERTALKVVAGKIVQEGAGVAPGGGQEFDPSTVWTGTTLSTALANAQASAPDAAGAQAADQEVLDREEALVGEQAAAGTGDAVGFGHAEGADHHDGAVKKIRARPPSPSRGETAASAGASSSPLTGAKPSPSAGAERSSSSGTKLSSSSSRAKHTFAATRSVARKLALQALYRGQLNDGPWQDLVQELGEAEDMANADRGYFRELVEGVWASRESLDAKLAELMDRPVAQLDPVEHAVLLIGLYELTAKLEVPYRVAINESVGLAKRFGATDGHKFVNAVLDRAARTLRPNEN